MLRYLRYLALRRYLGEYLAKKALQRQDSKDSKSLYLGGQRAKTATATRTAKPPMRDDTFAVGANSRLVVRGFNGRIRVRAGEPGSIRVRAKLKKPYEIKYSAVQEGDLITVEAKPHQPYQQSEELLRGFSRQHSGANIEVTVPVATSVDLATGNGPVELQGTESSGTVQTKNGPIRVEQFKGDLNATTKNAPITVKTLSGSAELYTSNSRVSIEDAHGRFDARTTNGSIKLQGSIEPGNGSTLYTTNGNIKVALDADPSLKLMAATVNGRVRCEVPGFVGVAQKAPNTQGGSGRRRGRIDRQNRERLCYNSVARHKQENSHERKQTDAYLRC